MPRYGNGPREGDDANRSRLFGNRTGNSYSSQGGGYAPVSSESSQYGGYAATSSQFSQNGGYGGAPAGYNSGAGRGSSYGHTQQSRYQDYGQSGVDQSQGDDSEERDIRGLKEQIVFTNRETEGKTRSALAAAARAEESGLAMLDSLDDQGEHLINAETNLDEATIHSRAAKERTEDLRQANRSMFAVDVKNPFRSKHNHKKEEARTIARNQREREERARTREFGYGNKNMVRRDLDTTTGRVESEGKSSPAERSRHLFEPNAEDHRIEDAINANLGELEAATARLKGIALAGGKLVDRQNEQIDRIMKKSDRVDDQIALSHEKLRKIH